MDQCKMGERNDVQNDLANIFWKEMKIGFGKPFGLGHGKLSFFYDEKTGKYNGIEDERQGKRPMR